MALEREGYSLRATALVHEGYVRLVDLTLNCVSPSGSGSVPRGGPMELSPSEITQLLKAWGAGDRTAFDKLMPLVYDDLRRVARRHMRLEREGHTLQTTALVHEVYLRLVDSQKATWTDRAHFFAVCARLMRQILVDSARSHRALKRGAGIRLVELDDAMAAPAEQGVDLIALDDALSGLTAFDARKGQVVEMRIFSGLSAQETADVLQVSTDTVTRDMHVAVAWLRRELGRERARGA